MGSEMCIRDSSVLWSIRQHFHETAGSKWISNNFQGESCLPRIIFVSDHLTERQTKSRVRAKHELFNNSLGSGTVHDSVDQRCHVYINNLETRQNNWFSSSLLEYGSLILMAAYVYCNTYVKVLIMKLNPLSRDIVKKSQSCAVIRGWHCTSLDASFCNDVL